MQQLANMVHTLPSGNLSVAIWKIFVTLWLSRKTCNPVTLKFNYQLKAVALVW